MHTFMAAKPLFLQNPLLWLSGSQKGVFWKGGLSRKVLFVEIVENLEILKNPRAVENKGESGHFLEI